MVGKLWLPHPAARDSSQTSEAYNIQQSTCGVGRQIREGHPQHDGCSAPVPHQANPQIWSDPSQLPIQTQQPANPLLLCSSPTHLAAWLAGPCLASLRRHTLSHRHGGNAAGLCAHNGAGAAAAALYGCFQDVLRHLGKGRAHVTTAGLLRWITKLAGAHLPAVRAHAHTWPQCNEKHAPHASNYSNRPSNLGELAPPFKPVQVLSITLRTCVVLPLPVSPLTTHTSCACSAATSCSRISTTGSLHFQVISGGMRGQVLSQTGRFSSAATKRSRVTADQSVQVAYYARPPVNQTAHGNSSPLPPPSLGSVSKPSLPLC